MENFEELDQESQEAFLETLGESINEINPDLLDDFGDIFGGFGDDEAPVTP